MDDSNLAVVGRSDIEEGMEELDNLSNGAACTLAQEFVYAVTVGDADADTAEIVADVARLAKADDVDSAYVGKKKRRPNGNGHADGGRAEIQ